MATVRKTPLAALQLPPGVPAQVVTMVQEASGGSLTFD